MSQSQHKLCVLVRLRAILGQNFGLSLLILSDMEVGHAPQMFMLVAEIEDAPGSIARLIQPFDVAGLVPRLLIVRRSEQDSLAVSAEFSSNDGRRMELVTAKLAQIPCVYRVTLRAR